MSKGKPLGGSPPRELYLRGIILPKPTHTHTHTRRWHRQRPPRLLNGQRLDRLLVIEMSSFTARRQLVRRDAITKAKATSTSVMGLCAVNNVKLKTGSKEWREKLLGIVKDVDASDEPDKAKLAVLEHRGE